MAVLSSTLERIATKFRDIEGRVRKLEAREYFAPTPGSPGELALYYDEDDCVIFTVLADSTLRVEFCDPSANILVGYDAGRDFVAGTGQRNVGIGYAALYALGDGYGNVGIGELALYELTDGQYNVAIGNEAGRRITTGDSNIALGLYAYAHGLTGERNIAIGLDALNVMEIGEDNIAVGWAALGLISDDRDGNIGIGYSALFNLGAVALAAGEGEYNTAVGYYAGGSWVSGSYNTAIGWEAGGNDLGGGVEWPVHHAIAIGAEATVTQNNAAAIGGVSGTEWAVDVILGGIAPAAKLHVIKEAEQLRLAYDAANFVQFIVDNTGDIEITPSGGDFNIVGNIGVTGTVDGVDVAAFKTTYDAHDHSAADPTQVDHANLTNVLSGQHHAQSHVLATEAGLGGDHTISGATVGDTLRATSPTAAAFARLQGIDIDIEQVGSPTYEDLQDWVNATQSAGLIAGGAITATSYTIKEADDVADTFTIAGDVSAYFTDGTEFTVYDSTGNDGDYTAVGDATYDGGDDETTITVANVPDGTDDGSIRDGRIDVAAVTGMIKTTDDSIDGLTAFVDIPAKTHIALVDATTNWVYASYGGGTPVIEVTDTFSDIDFNTEFMIGRVFRQGTEMHILEASTRISNSFRRIYQRIFELRAVERASGAITNDEGTRHFSVTAGVLYSGVDRFETDAFDSSGADRFRYWYHDGGGNWTSTDRDQAQIDNTQYDTGTGLAALDNNRYGVHWIFLHNDSHIDVVYGRASYKLAEAEATLVPPIPDICSDFATLVARAIVLKNATELTTIETAFAVLTTIETAFAVPFLPSVAPNHDDLSGVTADQHHNSYEIVNSSDEGVSVDADGTTTIKLGDNAGTQSLSIIDSGDAEIASVDSNGAAILYSIAVMDTTMVNNLNADQVDGYEAADLLGGGDGALTWIGW